MSFFKRQRTEEEILEGVDKEMDGMVKAAILKGVRPAHMARQILMHAAQAAVGLNINRDMFIDTCRMEYKWAKERLEQLKVEKAVS